MREWSLLDRAVLAVDCCCRRPDFTVSGEKVTVVSAS